jgi:small conductance mechanosensitive channel
MQTSAQQIISLFTTYGLSVLGAIVILIIGWIAARIGRRVTGNLLERSKVDPAVISFVNSLVYFLILTFTVLAALAKFGIQTTSFVAILGAAGFAIGFALQGALANFAAGVLILLLHPFRVDDYIMGAGEAGTVKEITLFSTVLVTPDNIKVMVPNGKLFGDVIRNATAYETRRVDLLVGISYDSDMQKACNVISDLMKQDSRILAEPAPEVAVSELGESRVNLVVRPWVKKDDYWSVKFDLTRKIKEAFDRSGIKIPFPQRTIHIISGGQTN